MHFIDTLILGLVEGLTEFLPISSTAHLLITGKLLALPETEFFKTFVIAIQLGAMLSIVLMYWKRVVSNFNLITKVLVAFIPTAIIGFLLYKIIKNFLFEDLRIIAFALIIGGIIILIFEYIQKKKRVEETQEILENISYTKSFFIGILQALAIIPGVSRSGATIIGGMLVGVSRKNIVEFSFLLAVPTIGAATVYDLVNTPIILTGNDTELLLFGFIFSFMFAWIGVKFLISYIEKNSFLVFGYYRIILGITLLTVVLP